MPAPWVPVAYTEKGSTEQKELRTDPKVVAALVPLVGLYSAVLV